jgi:cation transport regulator
VPYASNRQLPPPVQRHLPLHAQDIFRGAFNRAYEDYGEDEARAFRVAWAAVKRQYQKVEGEWLRR